MQVGSINAPQSKTVFDHLISIIMKNDGVSREEAEKRMKSGAKVSEMLHKK